MTCGPCNKGNGKRDFPGPVIEINNPEKIILFRKVVIPASMGDETAVPPVNGKYCNVLLHYDINKHNYIYSSDGIPTLLETEVPQDVYDRLETLGEEILAESEARTTADTALQNAITAEATARAQAIQAEATARAQAIEAEATARQNADTNLQTAITTETANRQTADNGLQTQIDALAASSDVTDIVGTYAALQAYDTTKLHDNDIIKVLQDETHQDETTYYRWNTSTSQFTLIGEEGPYYTKAATDTLLNAKADKATTYTKTETDNLLNNKADKATTYTKTEVDTSLALKADKATTYTKTETDTLLNAKQDTLTAGQDIDITNNVIKGTGRGLARELTSDDYNYHSSGDVDDGVALWLLPEGLYTCNNIKIYYTNSNSAASTTNTFLRTQGYGVGGSYGGVVIFRGFYNGNEGSFDTPRWLTWNSSTGGSGQWVTSGPDNYLLRASNIVNNLTSNTASKSPLSAAQGYTLKSLIDSIQTINAQDWSALWQ